MNSRNKISVESLLFALLFALVTVLFMVACNDSKSKDEGKSASTDTEKTDSAVVKKRTGRAILKTRLEENNSSNATTTKREVDKEGIYSSADRMPSYPGGSDALANYIRDNIEYPQDAMDNDIEGTVMVELVVDEKGNVSNVRAVSQKIGHGLEDEAVAVVSKTSGWTPAKIKNKNVKMKIRIPITYVIS
jgi:TonB family protein